jgi:hypothetical protein
MEHPARLLVDPSPLTLPSAVAQPIPETAAIVAEGRALDAVATHPLHGAVDEIAGLLGLTIAQLRAAVAELSSIGWVDVTQGSDGTLLLDLPGDAR